MLVAMRTGDRRAAAEPALPAGATATIKLRPPGAPAPLLPRHAVASGPRRRAPAPSDERRRRRGIRQVDPARGLGVGPELRLVHGVGRGRLAGHVRAGRGRRAPAARTGTFRRRGERRQGRRRSGHGEDDAVRGRGFAALICETLQTELHRDLVLVLDDVHEIAASAGAIQTDRGALPAGSGAPSPRRRVPRRAPLPRRAPPRTGAGPGDHRLAARLRRGRDRDAALRPHRRRGPGRGGRPAAPHRRLARGRPPRRGDPARRARHRSSPPHSSACGAPAGRCSHTSPPRSSRRASSGRGRSSRGSPRSTASPPSSAPRSASKRRTRHFALSRGAGCSSSSRAVLRAGTRWEPRCGSSRSRGSPRATRRSARSRITASRWFEEQARARGGAALRSPADATRRTRRASSRPTAARSSPTAPSTRCSTRPAGSRRSSARPQWSSSSARRTRSAATGTRRCGASSAQPTTPTELPAALAWRMGLLLHLGGRLDEAMAVYDRADESGEPRDVAMLLAWRAVRALASRGRRRMSRRRHARVRGGVGGGRPTGAGSGAHRAGHARRARGGPRRQRRPLPSRPRLRPAGGRRPPARSGADEPRLASRGGVLLRGGDLGAGPRAAPRRPHRLRRLPGARPLEPRRGALPARAVRRGDRRPRGLAGALPAARLAHGLVPAGEAGRGLPDPRRRDACARRIRGGGSRRRRRPETSRASSPR